MEVCFACPYAGDKEDVSGEINCTVSNKGSDNYGSIGIFIPGLYTTMEDLLMVLMII